MLLDICLGTRTSWKILFVLSETPGKAISRQEIRSLSKLGNKVISKFLLNLEAFNIVKKDKLGKQYLYKLNMANPYTLKILDIIKLEKEQLNNINFDILIILRELVYELTNIDFKSITNVILFGSYAKHSYSDNSDIDIAIFTKVKNPDIELLITDIIDRLHNRFGKEIQVHYYTTEEFKNNSSKLIQEIKKDGINLF